MKFMGATCVSEELGHLKKKKKNAWVSNESSRSRIECLRDCLAILDLLTVRVVVLENSQIQLLSL